jgi:hypothetical protein
VTVYSLFLERRFKQLTQEASNDKMNSEARIGTMRNGAILA